MNLHEYQSKQIFAEYKLPVSRGIACQTVEEGLQAMKTLDVNGWSNVRFTPVDVVKPVVLNWFRQKNN